MKPADNTNVVWVAKSDPMPDCCCDCGMFTYDRVTVKHVDEFTTAKSDAGCASIILTVIVHVFLGPLGWLIAVMMESDENSSKTKTVKKKTKLKLPQCNICRGVQPPEVIQSQSDRFAFRVHPKFVVRFEELRSQALSENE